jgi:hypothetical protein
MPTGDNKALSRSIFDGLSRNDVAIVDELYTPDFVLHDPAGLGGWPRGVNALAS